MPIDLNFDENGFPEDLRPDPDEENELIDLFESELPSILNDEEPYDEENLYPNDDL